MNLPALAGRVAPAALAALAGAACTTDPAPYPVDAVAWLEPRSVDFPIAGPIEVLGTGMPGNVADPGVRTFAAYHVALPEEVAPWVLLANTASCADLESPTPPDPPIPSQVIGTIRRVGDETHFFTLVGPVDGAFIEVDTQTAAAVVSPQLPWVVFVLGVSDLGVLACGALTWLPSSHD